MTENPLSLLAQVARIPVFRSAAEIPTGFGPTVASVGNFDGVHCGHREILSAVVGEAHQTGARAVAITFDPHPEQFLRPLEAPRLLTPIAQRLSLLAGAGVDAVVLLPFDAPLANLPAAEFVRQMLAAKLGVRALHEGSNFRFGRGAEAGIRELEALGAELGFAVRVHSAVCTHGLEVSSSAIRALVAAGDVRRARWMLGRPFSVVSTQGRGRGIGTRLLVPTVNLAPYIRRGILRCRVPHPRLRAHRPHPKHAHRTRVPSPPARRNDLALARSSQSANLQGCRAGEEVFSVGALNRRSMIAA